MEYEIIVVGGGHAGCEAALASARKGHKTILITGNIKNIADNGRQTRTCRTVCAVQRQLLPFTLV